MSFTCFGLRQLNFENFYNFLIIWLIFMKLVARCLALYGLALKGMLIFYTLTMQWTNSADDKLIFLLFFLENKMTLHANNLHEMSNPIF